MKILLVTDAWKNQVNGVVTTLENTVSQLRAEGHDVGVVHPGLFRTIPVPGYPEIKLAIMPSKGLEIVLNTYNPDHVHIATEGPLGLCMRKILRKKGEQWSSSFHTKFAEYVEARLGFGRQQVWRWLRYVYRDDAKILVTTNSMRIEMIQRGFGPPARLITWGRGVDETVFYPNLLRQTSCIPAILLNVGRVSVEKNLEAFYQLDVPGIKFQVGDGPMLETYKAKYPDVKFVGAKFGDDLAQFYRDADVMVFPSLSDTFGLVMIEAMRCGTPVAAYPVTGPIDIVENGQNGYMDNVLKIAVEKALDLPRQTVIKASQHFSWKNATEQFKSALVLRK